MTQTVKIKQYKAVKPEVCIKQFAETLESGWYATAAEALANFQKTSDNAATAPAPAALDASVEPTKTRGRPRKE